MQKLISAQLVLAITFLVGCGGSPSSNDSGGGSTPRLTSGNWSLSAKSSVVPGTTVYLGGSLNQAGSAVSGNLHVVGSDCYDLTVPISVTGSLNGTKLNITSASSNGQVISANLVSSGKSVSGTYSILGGCAGGDKGSVSGTWVPPISGTWAGTISTGSTTVGVTASVTQSTQAFPDGTFSLTGSMSYSNSPCSTGGTLSTGFIMGHLVYIQAATDDLDGFTGELDYLGFLDSPSTATQMSGNYWVNSGFCSGDSSSLHLTKQ